MRTPSTGVLLLLAGFMLHGGLPRAAQADNSVETWPVINQHILGNNCASCHQAGTPFAAQSGLELTSDVAYDELVGALSKNPAALADGLSRVSSAGGAAGLNQSLLWEKINAPRREHFFDDHPGYGSPMPLGRDPLTNGELEFVKRWILGGAPETGVVADLSLLEDITRYEPPVFAPLEPPEQGIQLRLGPFDVWPSEVNDREFLYFEPLVTPEDLYISQYEISYREGSHHFILYNYPQGLATPTPNEYRDLRSQQGNLNIQTAIELNQVFPFQFFIGTQSPQTNYSLPEGVALRLPAGSGFDLNTHSVNRTDETRQGEVYVNLHTVDLQEVKHVADYANFGNFDINLPANQVTTIEKTFTFSETRNIVQMWSHSHEHTVEFRIERVGGERDGELIYWSDDWEHPSLLQFDTPLTFEAGDQIRLVTTYNNTTDAAISFGPLSSDEMQFMFYIYYTELTGDVNLDKVVDRADVGRLVSKFGETQAGSAADINDDAVVSLLDLAALQANFRRRAEASVAVPEPGTMVLALLGMGVVFWGSRRRVVR